MYKNQIQTFCEDNPRLVNIKDTSNPNLRVLKYHNRVFYNNLWTPELLECRGTVIDKEWNVVSRPFTKIFNYGEDKAPYIDPNEWVTSVRKINGFMACLSFYNGEPIVSTTGTIDSPFAEVAKQHLRTYIDDFKEILGETQSAHFEIVDCDDPHIIADEWGVWFLNIRENAWHAKQHMYTEARLDDLAKDLHIKRPEWKEVQFKDVFAELKTCDHEGFVVYTPFGEELKFKSLYYLTTKFLGRMGEKNVDFMYSFPEKFKKTIDEEFYDLVDIITSKFPKETFMFMEKPIRILVIRELIDTMREK